jgi:two-component system sensor histidine kinase PilS (NtrC family)
MLPAAIGLERRLVVLMAARLALSLLSLGIALMLDAYGDFIAVAQWGGVYVTVAVAFFLTVGYGLILPHVRRQRRFAALNLATDIAIVTALVYFSGGSESVFAFLYVLVAFYGAVLFDRAGALIAAGLAAGAYGVVLMAGHWGLPGAAAHVPLPMHLLFTRWAVHAGAAVLVATLSSFLAAELRQTDEALAQRTSDLHRLRNFHRRVVDSLMSGLLTTDEAGRITSFNPEAESITGLKALEAMGREVEEVLPGTTEAAIDPAGEGRANLARARIGYRNLDGEERFLGIGAYVLKGDNGDSVGHVVIFQDVTEVVAMENDLRRSERLAAVGELAASIAHEIRNPLAAISGSIQMLNQPDSKKEAVAGRLMDIAIREADRLNHLITDFLHYARPGPTHSQVVRIEEAVDEVLELFEAVRPESVVVETAIEPGACVSGDSGQLRQVLWNLVRNGSEAMPDGGRLRITARIVDSAPQDGGPGLRNGRTGGSRWAEIAVADQGLGIPPELLERIFDPFFTTKPKGSGLGLATVHRIVDEHGGSVRLESAPGTGTTIRLWLPDSETRA